jgi:hypothetical protein
MAASDVYQVNLAAAALAFALFSFIVATVQALGQYFSTADGYRRCKASLVGHWAQKVRLRWRWSQLRFESMFTTPDIFLSGYTYDEYQGIIPSDTGGGIEWVAVPSIHRKLHHDKAAKLNPESEKLKELDHNYHLPESQDLACWLYLLNSLRSVEVQRQRGRIYASTNGTEFFSPACRLRERSWDLMSPELVRPLARTTVSDIAIMVRRLGMTWRSFQPEEGMMSAEGNGHLVYSTYVRSLGVSDPLSIWSLDHFSKFPPLQKFVRNIRRQLPD